MQRQPVKLAHVPTLTLPAHGEEANERLEGKKERDNDASPVQAFPGKRPSFLSLITMVNKATTDTHSCSLSQCFACGASMIHPRKQPELRLSLTRIQDGITFPSVNGVYAEKSILNDRTNTVNLET